MSTITFLFFGNGGGMGPGEFSINLSNFMGGDTITNVTYASGNLQEGDFTTVSWEGTSATFTGSSGIGYAAAGGESVVFNVTTAAEPEDFGDYNQNGVVDAADYVVWRKNDGPQEQYNTWRTNFGTTVGGGSESNATVPEPAAALLLVLGGAIGCWRTTPNYLTRCKTHRPGISHPSSRVSVWVIPTNEELMIAQHTRKLLTPR